MGRNLHLQLPADRVTPDELEDARLHMWAAWPFKLGGPEGLFEHVDYGDGERFVMVATGGQRYFGPGHARGHWPAVAAAIELLHQQFPGVDVYAGTDHDALPSDAVKVDDEWLAERWALWNSMDHDAEVTS